MTALPWPDSERSPWQAVGDLLENLSRLPARMDGLESALAKGGAPEKRLLTVKEAGQLLGVSDTKIRELVRRGELSVRRIDSAVRIAVTDLDAYVESLAEDER